MILQQDAPEWVARGSTDDERRLRASIKEYGEQFPRDPPDEIRVVQMVRQLQIANELAPGDYIELGVFRGMTLKIIYRYMDQARTLYGLDTFRGFDARDIEQERQVYGNGWREGNFLPTSASRVAEYVAGRRYPANLKLIEGWFPESFVGLEDLRWRFAHIDMDLFAPICAALKVIWPRMVPGGVVMVHDYGCSSFRANVAVDQFCRYVAKVPPVIMADRYSTAVIRKPFE